MRTTRILGTLAGALTAGAAGAGDLAPMAAHSIALGPVVGTAYYTVEPAGFRVVATFASGEGTRPVRVVAVLLPGQAATISVPRAVGERPLELELLRVDDTLRVTRSERMADLYRARAAYDRSGLTLAGAAYDRPGSKM
jgi:hypothetical protein